MDITITIGTRSPVTETVTPTEEWEGTFRIAGGASDVSIALGTLTDPKCIFITSDIPGVSIKLGAGGVDDIAAYKFAYIADTDAGLGVSSVLVSNAGGNEAVVYMYAAE